MCSCPTLVFLKLTLIHLTQDLEDECLKPEPSYKLLEIGLCLLKWISSHRGLTYVDNCNSHVNTGGANELTGAIQVREL